MKKLTTGLIGLLLALVLCVSLLPVTAQAADAPSINAWNIALKDSIVVNFNVTVPDIEGTTISATVNGAAVETSQSVSGNTRTVSVPLAAAQLNDSIKLIYDVNGTQSESDAYTVRQYADYILNGNFDVAVKQMVSQLLTYGAAAQNYFNYNTGALANEGVQSIYPDITMPTEVTAVSVADNLNKVTYFGTSLVFRSQVYARFYFTMDDRDTEINNYTVTINGEDCTYGKFYDPNGRFNYFADSPGITPNNYDQPLEVVITNTVDNTTLTVSYSPLNYIVNKSSSSTANLPELMKAMYGYHVESHQYMNYENATSTSFSSAMEYGTNGIQYDSNSDVELIFAGAAANSMPVAQDYYPQSADCIKLVRNGETTSVADVTKAAIQKCSEDAYHIYAQNLTVELQDQDILILDDKFSTDQADSYYDGETLDVSTAYVYVDLSYSGTAEITDTMPILPSTVEATINNGSCAMNANAVYASAAANDAPVAAYTVTTADNIKLIRDGVTTSIGVAGRVAIEKRENDYLLKVNSDCIGDYAPLQAGDVLVFQGDFYYADQKVTLNVPATYIFVYRPYVDGTTGEVVISATAPAIYESTVPAGTAINANNIYATATNDAPTGYYQSLKASNIKLIRDGETIDVAVERGVAIEKTDSYNFLKVNSDCIGSYAPLQAGDVLIFEGDFYNKANNAILRLPATYVYVTQAYVDGTNGTAVVSDTMPILPSTVEATINNGSCAINANAVYASAAANDAPVAAYTVTTADNIKLIRDGVTTSIGVAGRVAIEKRENDYLLKVNSDCLGEYAPLVNGDILVLEGEFYNASSKVTLNVAAAYIYVYRQYVDGTNGEVVISATAPSIYESTVPAGTAMNANNIYATATNDAPATTYQSLKASNIKLIRDGVTVDVAVERGVAIEKTTSYNFLKPNSAAIGDYAPLQAGDVLIFEGDFYNKANNAILRLPATYVFVYKAVDSTNGEVVITSEAPAIVECGALSGTQLNANVVYTTATNDAPTGNYRLLVAEDYQLIRGGETYNIGTLRTKPVIEKTDSWIYLKINSDAIGSYAPLQAGDVLVVKGQFYNKESNAILRVEDTYVYVQTAYVTGTNGTVVISATMPVPYTVTLDAAGGACSTASLTTTTGGTVTLPDATRTHYTFNGWSDGTTTYVAGTKLPVTSDMNLTAQWTPIVYTVTFNANGGSVSTASAPGSVVTAVTLPTPTREHYTFNGWYTAASGGTKVDGATYTPTGNVILYAQWTIIQYTVSYNHNGGDGSTASATVNAGTEITLPKAPTRSGYRFTGWYTAASGGTKVGDANASYTPTGNVTVYAQWIAQYTVTYDSNGGNSTPDSVTVDSGTTIVLAAAPSRSSYTFKGWSDGSKTYDANASYEVTGNVTFTAQWQRCLVEGTLITMADGTLKAVEDIVVGDEVLTWSFINGTYEIAPVCLAVDDGVGEYTILTLNFEDGTALRVIDEHGVFDADLNKYAYINPENVDEYIGHVFVKLNADGSVTTTKFTGYSLSTETVGCYTLQTAFNVNCVAEGLLTQTPPLCEGYFDYFEMGDFMQYDQEQMQADIEKYGLYTYEDFQDYLTYDAFIAFNGPYLKVAVGKGYFTFDYLVEKIKAFGIGIE